MRYTTDDLLRMIKSRAFIPVSQETFSDSDLLEMASDELMSQVVPEVLSTREEWYVTPYAVPVDFDTRSVEIPSRSIGGSLREVSFTDGGLERNLARLSLEDRHNQTLSGPLSAFYVQGNDLMLFGSQTGTLNMYFNCRPGRLVATSIAAAITAVDLDTKTLTVDTVPAEWSTGTVLDIVKAKPHFEYKNLSLTVVNISGQDIEFAETLADDIALGDWVTPEDTSPAPQIPVEWFQYLAECVVMQVFLSQGDKEAADQSEKKMERLKKSALSLMSPRVQGEARRLVPPKNRGGIFNNRWR